MPYQTIALSALPKRVAPEKTWDKAAAEELLAIISGEMIEGSAPTATDGVAYADQKAARSEANKAKRLVTHVLPEGKIVTSAIFGLDPASGQPVAANAPGVVTFGWAVVLKDAPEAEEVATEAPAKGKGK